MKSITAFVIDKKVSVAPFAGAWIEITDNVMTKKEDVKSLRSPERGLKFKEDSRDCH